MLASMISLMGHFPARLASQALSTENIIYYVAAGILTIAVLVGISMMSRVRPRSQVTPWGLSACSWPSS